MIKFAPRPNFPEKPCRLNAFKLTPLRNRRFSFACTSQGLPQPFAFEPYLFLRPDHLATQSADTVHYFQLLDHKTQKIVVHFPVFISNEKGAYSPGRASFGGLQVAPGLLVSVLSDFLNRVHEAMLQMGNGREIYLKTAPIGFAPAEATHVTNLLLKLGYQVSASEVNHHLAVSDLSFASQVYNSARRRMVKCRKAGFYFQEEQATFLPEAFTFIRICREEKGHTLSLSLDQLAALFYGFPEEFRIFAVRTSEQELAACTVAVRVNKDILYNFYPASPLRFNNFSPAVMLAKGLYEVCRQEGFRILDLGTSALPQGPNFPLMNFKKHLGGQPSLKLSFTFRG